MGRSPHRGEHINGWEYVKMAGRIHRLMTIPPSGRDQDRFLRRFFRLGAGSCSKSAKVVSSSIAV